jgi:hypothetical protein
VYSSRNSYSVIEGVIDVGTNDGIQIVSCLYLKNERSGAYSAICIDYKRLSKKADPSSSLLSIMMPQVDSKEHIIHILKEMMKKGVTCKELSAAYGIIHSLPISQLKPRDSSQSSLEYSGDGSISKTRRVSPSVLSQTMRFVESIYGFSESASYQNVFVLTQEDMFALVFSCLSESEVISII